MKAFVSYIRHYQEHHASYIFRLKDLDMSSLMEMFCLLKVPRVPELAKRKIDYRTEPIDINSIPFKDKTREKQRLEKQEKRKIELAE